MLIFEGKYKGKMIMNRCNEKEKKASKTAMTPKLQIHHVNVDEEKMTTLEMSSTSRLELKLL